ncbi:hypothetical protein MTO96_020597 [Rhipicephalus appendiculatus]
MPSSARCLRERTSSQPRRTLRSSVFCCARRNFLWGFLERATASLGPAPLTGRYRASPVQRSGSLRLSHRREVAVIYSGRTFNEDAASGLPCHPRLDSTSTRKRSRQRRGFERLLPNSCIPARIKRGAVEFQA